MISIYSQSESGVTQNAQQSVHLTGGILRHFRAFSTPEQNPALEVLSTPAHPQVTQTVRRFVYSRKDQKSGRRFLVDILKSVQKDYPVINKTAGEFLYKLSGNNIKKDVILAAEMSGLKLLRAANVDVSKMTPGVILLGAIPDETYDLMQRFVFEWAMSNWINPLNLGKVKIPDDVTNYLPEVVQLETSFENICQQNAIKVEYYPFVAASSALKLVAAGKKMKLLDARIGLAMTMYHIISGSKTVPNQTSSETTPQQV